MLKQVETTTTNLNNANKHRQQPHELDDVSRRDGIDGRAFLPVSGEKKLDEIDGVQIYEMAHRSARVRYL